MEVLENSVSQAYDLFSKKDFESALEVLDKSDNDVQRELTEMEQSKREEYLSSMHNFRGFIFLGMGDNDSAQDSFEKGLQSNPNSSQSCAGLGEVLFLKEKDDDAKVMFEWALDLNPKNEFARAGLIKVNKSLGLPNFHNTMEEEALSEDEQVIFNKCITDAYKHFKEKNFEDSLEKINRAQGLITKGILSNSTFLKISSLENFKGFNHLALDNFDAAQACFEKSLNLDATSSQACAGLGELYYLKGMDMEAKTMFEFSVKHDEQNDFAISGLAKINKILGLDENDNSKLNSKAG